MKNTLAKAGSLIAIVLMMSAGAFANDNNDFSNVDGQGIVPKRPLQQALAYFKKNRNQFTNQKVITIIDFTKKSNQKRMFIVDLRTGKVEARMTSHGSGSDKNHDGKAESFGNKDGSYKSSLGFYRTLETYNGKHGYSLKLQGLSSTNSAALGRAIVIHSAWYVNEAAGTVGRSQGCPALDKKYYKQVISKIKGGSLLYAWNGQ